MNMEWEKPEQFNLDPIFRVVRVSDWEQGLKLEEQFWWVLKLAAKEEDKSFADFIKSILDQNDHKNKTAFLRNYAMNWALQKYEHAAERLCAEVILKKLHSAPVPSVAVTKECSIFSCSAEFMEIIRAIARNSANESSAIESAAIAFSHPIKNLFRSLSEGQFETIDCEYRLIINKESKKYRARANIVPCTDIDAIILYNVSTLDD